MTADNLFASPAAGSTWAGNFEVLRETDGTVAWHAVAMTTPRSTTSSESGGRLFIIARDEPNTRTTLRSREIGMSPSSVTGPAQVTITGRGLQRPVTVSIGGGAATVGSTTPRRPCCSPRRRVGLSARTVTLDDRRGRTFDATPILTLAPAHLRTGSLNSAPASICPMAPSPSSCRHGRKLATGPATDAHPAS